MFGRVTGDATAVNCRFAPAFIGHARHRREESIADFWQRLYKSRAVRGVTECLSEALDGSVQPGIESDKGVAGPQTFAQFLSRNDFAGVFKESYKDLKRLFLEANPAPVFQQFARPD